MNFVKLASLPQVNTPAWPPVETMYFLPALMKLWMLPATWDGVMPAHDSLPHSPVANAQVRTVSFAGMICTTGVSVPVTLVLNTLVFQLLLIVTSLKGPYTKAGGGG